MLRKLRDKQQGFTIVEVVIVLAIAGLIFAVVFIAVPQLQQSQRDTERGSAFDRLESAITQYQSHNTGDIPDFAGSSPALSDFVDQYMDGEFDDPIGGEFTVGTTANYEAGEFEYVAGENCNGDTGGRYYAITYEIEQGDTICRDNS